MDSAKKRRVKSAISWILSIGLIGAITGGALLSDAKKPVDTGTRVVNGTVSLGTIEQTLRGGGKLADHYDFKMSLPSGVKLESYLVEEGQVVESDEAVAVVDQVSLNQTILSVYQAVSDITGEIETLLSEENLEDLKSSVTGEVKEIYVTEGSDIR
ncbi:MAG: hypothetical protein J6P72_09950, partial [Firmicutes bacterium]|nr:hypothetical protein [Bacillota bacterium]